LLERNQLRRHSQTEGVFVGFAGRIGAGKTCASKYLSSTYGFQYTRYSRILRDWLAPGIAGRERLQTFGWEIMAGGRQAELNARLIAGLDPLQSAVVDGLRHPIDFESLLEAFGSSFHMIFLEARREVRFERLRSRLSTFELFQAAESQPVEAHTDSLKAQASAIISNQESLEALYQQLDIWVSHYSGIGVSG
jgi:dephospho-CoA kinase